VRHQSLELDAAERLHRPRDIFRAGLRSQPAQTSVDLQVISHWSTTPRSQQVKVFQIFDRMNHRRQVMLNQSNAPDRKEVGHDQDAGIQTRLPQRHSLFYIADSQPARALGYERSRDFNSAVAISIRLDDGHYLYIRAGCITDSLKIGGNL
jgi:hypothetical protein